MANDKQEQAAEGFASQPSADGQPRRRFLTSPAVRHLPDSWGPTEHFAYMLGEFVYPAAGKSRGWLFVCTVDTLAEGEALDFTSPTGAKVVVARQGAGTAAEDFLALSSVCPHLGCRVHWEVQNDRFFCPCHNGAFDRDGKPVSGPPQAANQSLVRFPLKVENGLLFLEVPLESIASCPVEPSKAHHLHDETIGPELRFIRSRLRWDVIADWFHERVPISGEHLAELTNEPVPNHLKRWWFCLGGTPAYLFVVQIVTGILLALVLSAVRLVRLRIDSVHHRRSHLRLVSAEHAQVGGDADDRGHDSASDACVFHRSLPATARAELDDRHVAADVHAADGFHRLQSGV